ncbi:hypothetical protein NPX13_g3087 [Xylaria arbuscula]|uniref:Peptidase S8/S53 domain-containing protein n=1 Tax=Xylaria arbuscula TaxID=114810 RepID=A0A9W8TQG3_9PEZI|nr:hypothetical protein NPX13_g3087 [Xylaria arbuscula]
MGANVVVSDGALPIFENIESLKSDFEHGRAQEWSRFTNPASQIAESLSSGIQKLVDENSEVFANILCTEQLSKFLANESNEYIVDDCVRFYLLRYITDPTTPPTDLPTSQAFTALKRILIESQPQLSFLPTDPKIIKGDFSALEAIETETNSNMQNGHLFSWNCSNESHKKSVSRGLKVSAYQYLSPFYHALKSGDLELVKLMVESMDKFLMEELPKHDSIHTADGIISSILGTDRPRWGTPLEYTYESFITPDTAEVSATSPLPQHLGIIEYLLKQDPTLVTRKIAHENLNSSKSRQDNTFRTALDDLQLVIVRLILKYAPQDFLRENDIIEELSRGRKIQDTRLETLFIEFWCRTRKLTLGIGNEIIKHDRIHIWELPSISSRIQDARDDTEMMRELLKTAVNHRRPKFVEKILRLIPGTFDTDLAREVVKCGLLNIWKLPSVIDARKSLLDSEVGLAGDLLVLAIQNKEVEFVEDLLKNDQSLAVQRSDVAPEHHWALQDERDVGIYPLWHNNYMVSNDGKNGWQKRMDRRDPDRISISKVLVHACIRETKSLRKLCDIFRYSHQTVDTLSFDISLFNSSKFSLSEFAQSLPTQASLPHDAQISHHFQSVLHSAAFPTLVPDRPDDWRGQPSSEHEEVFQCLQWLQEQNKVEEILRLRVPDRIYNPHDEHAIAEWVKTFRVQVLDWKRLDLAISAFEDSSGDSIREIHLYSSGRRATITHWLGSDGIQSLHNIRKARIYLIKEAMSQQGMEKMKEVLKRGITSLKRSRPEIDCEFEEKSWNERPSQIKSTLSDIAKRAVPRLSSFIKQYHDHVYNKLAKKEHFRPTKVAIIDNGIMNINPMKNNSESTHQKMPGISTNTTDNREGGFHRVVNGQSFVDEDSTMMPWSFASDPHGTQMMNLICAIDPCCEIFVAKVVVGKQGIISERVARAIQWAIDQEVDIISMSLACYENDESVNDAVIKADTQGILVLCSAHDEGLNVPQAWPARLDETITFAASNEFGGVTRNRSDAYDFCLRATDIFAGSVPFMEYDECVSGSSVATAIGAGLSSLVISCHYLANDNRPKRAQKWKKEMVKRVLEETALSNPGSKYVNVDNFCGVDKNIDEFSPFFFEDTILNQNFKVWEGNKLGSKESKPRKEF